MPPTEPQPFPNAHSSISPAVGESIRPVVVPPTFVDRRRKDSDDDASPSSRERRQFGNSHLDLSEDGRELAAAIDAYKVQYRRRYLTCDEMLNVIRSLGYARPTDRSIGDA